MPVYRIIEPRFGQLRVQEWRRRALRTLGLLFVTLISCTAGLIVLSPTDEPLTRKAFTALWNAVNLITTLGDFTDFTNGQKGFVIMTMVIFMIVGGYAVSTLTGILSSDAVMAHRENRAMERTLNHLTNHVVVIGFGALGRLVAGRLRASGDCVLVIDRNEELGVNASELGYLVVQGDAGVDDKVLTRAQINTARALVVTTEDPDRKLAITLMAHTLNPQLTIAVTGQNSPRGALLQHAGAAEVVVVDELVAGVLVERLGKPPAT
jgi:voltage-gated potassium channel